MNMMSNVIAAWLPLIVWQQIDAPKYHKGFITASCEQVLFVVVIAGMAVLQNRETRK
jgi:MFS transporter, ACS family, pantothenate transporter